MLRGHRAPALYLSEQLPQGAKVMVNACWMTLHLANTGVPTWAVQVIKRANDTTYGLAAGVFTKDINKANCLARALRVGNEERLPRAWGLRTPWSLGSCLCSQSRQYSSLHSYMSSDYPWARTSVLRTPWSLGSCSCRKDTSHLLERVTGTRGATS